MGVAVTRELAVDHATSQLVWRLMTLLLERDSVKTRHEIAGLCSVYRQSTGIVVESQLFNPKEEPTHNQLRVLKPSTSCQRKVYTQE